MALDAWRDQIQAEVIDSMRDGAKKRLAGVVVLVTLAVIFVPMLFEDRTSAPPSMQAPLPPPPEFKPPQMSHPYAVKQPAGPGLTPEELELKPVEQLGTGSPPPSESPAPIAFEPPQEPAPLPQPVESSPRPATPTAPPRATGAVPSKPAVQPAKPAPAAPVKPAVTPTAKAESNNKSETPVNLPEPPKSRATGMPSWVVQVSSLNSPEAAARLADKLKQSGFSAFIERAEVSGKIYYRVRVGPDSDRTTAERTAAQLREQHKLDTLIQRYEPGQR